MTGFLIAIVPSIGVGWIFWVAMRAIMGADRREREAQARLEADERLESRRPAGDQAADQARDMARDVARDGADDQGRGHAQDRARVRHEDS